LGLDAFGTRKALQGEERARHCGLPGVAVSDGRLWRNGQRRLCLLASENGLSDMSYAAFIGSLCPEATVTWLN
jgi:hypothetical protein